MPKKKNQIQLKSKTTRWDKTFLNNERKKVNESQVLENADGLLSDSCQDLFKVLGCFNFELSQ